MTEGQAALIARIEAATGADMELNGAIAFQIGWTFQKMKGDARPYWRKPDAKAYWQRHDVPFFTGSLDAALTLVPADYWWGIIMRGAKNSGFSAATLPHDTKMVWHVGATPALALCLAALRARWA